MPADPATASTDALKRSDLKVEYLAIDKLTPFARNARTHSEGQVEQIANSMREFGWTNPILIDPKGMIIAGHGRIMAAERLKIAQVPVIRLTGLSAAQKRALVLADNKLASNAGWDIDLLRLELGDLKADGFNLDITGFNAFEIADIFATKDGKTDPDAAPPLEEKPVSKTGDTWLLGPHRLTCGDSTKPDDVAACLKGARPMLCVTDPPYGVEYDADWRNKAIRSNGTPIAGRAIGKVQNDDRIDWSPAFKLFAGDVLYCWHAGRHASEVQQSLEAATFQIRTQIIWAKTRFAIGRGHYHWQHEPCWYAVRKGKTGRWVGGHKQTTLWTIEHQRSETGHSTQKPVECMQRPIKNHTKAGEFVYEPFSGSGTTIIAAEMTGRVCLAIEIAPNYVDLAVRRWEQFTGKTAKLESTGQTFIAVERARALAPKPKRAAKGRAAANAKK